MGDSSSSQAATGDGLSLFDGEGEVRARLRAIDWSRHPLGPPDLWPESLRLPVSICLNSLFSMSIWWGPDRTLIYNDAYAPLLAGRHPGALAASARVSWADVWPSIEPQLEAVLEGKPSVNVRTWVPTNRQGVMTDSWFTWAFTPIIGRDGKIEGNFVVCTEETENVIRERELMEARDRLAVTLSAAEIGYWSLDAESGKAVADANLAKAFSISPELAESGAPLKVFTDAIHELDRERTVSAIKQAMAGGDTFEAEYRLTPHGTSIRWVLARGMVTRDEARRPVRMSGVLIDITERVKSEQLLSAQNAVLKLVASETSLPHILEALVLHVEAMSPGAVSSILLVDDEGCLRYGAGPSLPAAYNQAVDGIRIGEHVGTCGRAAYLKELVISPDLANDPDWAPLRDEVAALGLRAAWSMPIVSATGKILATFGTYYRERRSPTTQERAVVEFLSQTAAIAIERAQAQQVLQAAEIELRQHAQQLEVKVQERTVRLRDTITELETFSYSVSHDMRAPLRAMQAFARILEEECGEQVSDDGKGYIRRIISASERMDRLIQDMLVYSRLAPANLEMERVDTHALFTGIIQSYPQFHDDAVRIRILNPLPAVKGNETALNQCFANLLNNGIKFARPGIKPEIDVSAETRGDTARITFRDNGVGIDASQWEKIFGLFYRVNRATEGTGIGLAIVKKAMERMNGSVGLTSEPGQGSAFYLELARGDD